RCGAANRDVKPRASRSVERAQPDVGGKCIEMQASATIDDDANLRREHEPYVHDRLLNARGKVGCIDEYVGVVGQWIDENGNASDRRNLERRDFRGKVVSGSGAQTTDLKTAASGDFDGAVAMPARRRAKRNECLGWDAAARRKPRQQ